MVAAFFVVTAIIDIFLGCYNWGEALGTVLALGVLAGLWVNVHAWRIWAKRVLVVFLIGLGGFVLVLMAFNFWAWMMLQGLVIFFLQLMQWVAFVVGIWLQRSQPVRAFMAYRCELTPDDSEI